MRYNVLMLMANYPEELTCFIYLAQFTRILSSVFFIFLRTSIEDRIKAILEGKL